MLKCTRFTSYERGTLQGFATIETPSGMVINGCTLNMKNGKRWVYLPSKESPDSTDDDKKYFPIISFTEKEKKERFCDEALKAIEKYCTDQAREPKEYIADPNEEILF